MNMTFKLFKKLPSSVIFTLILIFASSLYSQSVPLTPDIGKIVKSGKLRVAMVKADQVPFFFKNGQVIEGSDVDMAKDIADALGVKLEINRDAKSFNDLIPLVSSGKVDVVISKLSRTLKRAQSVIFSEPYMTFSQALAFNRVQLAKKADSDFKIRKLVKSFNGRIGVIKGSSYVTYAKLYFPNSEIVEYENWEEVIRGVMEGEVLAAYRDEFEIKKILQSNPDFNLTLKLVVLKDLKDYIAVALGPNSIYLRDFINIYLSSIKPQTTKQIFSRYQDVIKNNKIEINK